MKIETLTVGSVSFKYTDRVIETPSGVADQLLDLLVKWQGIFPVENTFVSRTYGVPSLFVRFDGTVDSAGRFHTYEIQDGCAWIGYAGVVNSEFRTYRDRLARGSWPPIKMLLNADVDHHDDELWLDAMRYADALKSSDLLMIRQTRLQKADPAARASLIARSVKPVETHGDKEYGVSLGWWRRVSWHEISEAGNLPWDKAFALKPIRGFGSRDIMIWKPQSREGRSTKTQVVAALAREKTMYLQDFIPPMRVEIAKRAYHMILRPFFAYDPLKKAWTTLHGVWVARPAPNLRIHGASDAIAGPLIIH